MYLIQYIIIAYIETFKGELEIDLGQKHGIE